MAMLAAWRKQAAAARLRIALSEPADARVLRAAARALDFCEVCLICADAAEVQAVKALAEKEGVAEQLGRMQLVDAAGHPERQRMEEQFKTARGPGKKVPDFNQPLYFANLLVRSGLVDGHVAGAVATSGDVTKAALSVLGTAPGVSRASSYFVMSHPNRPEPLIFADCAVSVNPTSEELAEIADLAASNLTALIPSQEPRVALLSFSTKGSAGGPEVEKVTMALQLLKQRRPTLKADGELQLDAALIEKTAKSKAPGSEVAGKANVLVFPNLSAGNIGYKLTERLGGFQALGPVFQGLKYAANDLSRGCSIEDVEGMMIITALQALQAKTVSKL